MGVLGVFKSFGWRLLSRSVSLLIRSSSFLHFLINDLKLTNGYFYCV